MNSKEYIIAKLNEMVEKNPDIEFLYQYDEIDQTHIVEVSPLTSYEKDNEYKDAEGDLTFEFDRMFSPETIMFVSQNSLTRVSNPEEVIKKKYSLDWDNNELPFVGDFTVPDFNFLTNKNVLDFNVGHPITEDLIFSSYSLESELKNETSFSSSKNNYALAA